MNTTKSGSARVRPFVRLSVAGALLAWTLVALCPAGAFAQAPAACVTCDCLLNSCSGVLASVQATRDEQQATIADLQRQLADLRKGKGFSGLSDYQAFAIASAAVERLEEPAAADASAKELSEKAEQLKALQQRTSKLSDKLKARAVQQRAVESTR